MHQEQKLVNFFGYNHTRPDISCDVSILGSKLKDIINEFQTVNKLIKLNITNIH